MSTKIKPLNHCPAPDAWQLELRGESIPPRWLVHLEQCTECQHTLDQLAADPKMWLEAQETLVDRPVDLTHITAAILPLSMEPTRNLLSDPLCEYELAQLQRLLPPASGASSIGTSSLGLGGTVSYPPCEPIVRIGRYDLEQLVGRGGMGLVFRAWDTQLHRVVAVKTLSMSLWSMPSARERFIREGRAAAMLNHPNIVPMYDVINDPPVPALVMQYIAGPTLDEWIHTHGPLVWTHALRIALQLADALCAAHAEGLVHRDIKPGNVLLEADGTRALLTDFGLVRAMDDATLTQSGLLAGTPHFMSPEQAKGEEVDGRSDLFSLGSLLYYAISGQTPFRGRESMSVLNSLCHAPHEPLCRVTKEVPLEVSRLVDRLLQKQPQQRQTSSQEVRDSLRRLLSSEHRLRPKRIRRPVGKRLMFLAVAATFMSILYSVYILSHPRETAWQVRGSWPSSNYALDSSAMNDSAAMSSGMPGLDSAHSPSTSGPPVRMPAPNATELDALAEETDLLLTEIESYSMLIEPRLAEGESLSLSLWQANQEIEQVQVGLRVPSENNTSSTTGE